MSEAEIRKGCTEYTITCGSCGFTTFAHELSKQLAVETFREDGWSIGLRGNNICPDCPHDNRGRGRHE